MKRQEEINSYLLRKKQEKIEKGLLQFKGDNFR